MQEFLQAVPAEAIMGATAGLIRFVLLLLLTYVASRVVSRVIGSLRTHFLEAMKRGAGGSDEELGKRATTLIKMIRKGAIVGIWILGLVMALRELGFDIGPLLAGAGVMGLAIGFGAQNLVRDVISGVFFLIENQIRVNDVAVINGTGGLVEEVNLRTTVLRSLDGTVHVFPNGTITTLSNMTREYSYYVFDLGVAYKEDVDHVMDAIRAVGRELQATEPFASEILGPVEIFGVDKFADSAVVIKGRIKTRPIQQWMVGREFNRRIKRRFDELGIEIPLPHLSLYAGEASRPFRLEGMRVERDELKQAVREVLSELKS